MLRKTTNFTIVSNIVFSKKESRVTDMAVDDIRNILYVLFADNTSDIYWLGVNGDDTKRITCADLTRIVALNRNSLMVSPLAM